MNYSKIRNEFTAMILKAENLTANETLVALILKEAMNNNTGRCYPSFNTIAKQAKLSRSSVIRAVKGLEDKLYIAINKEHYNGQQHNIYSFILNNNEGVVSERHQGGVRETLGVVSERHPNILLQPSINIDIDREEDKGWDEYNGYDLKDPITVENKDSDYELTKGWTF